MPKFRVYGVVTGTKYLGEFEAATEDEVEIMAANSKENSFRLCNGCSGQFDLDDHSCNEFIIEKSD